MALIYIHTKFPKTKKAYTKAGDENTAKLKQIMSKLTISSNEEAPESGASLSWAYTDRRRDFASSKKGKNKTFKL